MGRGRRAHATATAIAALGVVFQGAGASMGRLQNMRFVSCLRGAVSKGVLWFRGSRHGQDFASSCVRIWARRRFHLVRERSMCLYPAFPRCQHIPHCRQRVATTAVPYAPLKTSSVCMPLQDAGWGSVFRRAHLSHLASCCCPQLPKINARLLLVWAVCRWVSVRSAVESWRSSGETRLVVRA